MSEQVPKISLIKIMVLPSMDGLLPRDIDPERIERWRRDPKNKRRHISSLMEILLVKPVSEEGIKRILPRPPVGSEA